MKRESATSNATAPSNAVPLATLKTAFERRESAKGKADLRQWVEAAKVELGIASPQQKDLLGMAAKLTADTMGVRNLQKICGFARIADVVKSQQNSSEWAGSVAEAAQRLGVEEREVTAAFKAGCTARRANRNINVSELRAFLAVKKKKKPAPKKKKRRVVKSISDQTGGDSDAAVIARLFEHERVCHEEKLDAERGSNMDLKAEARSAWLEASGSLLQYLKVVKEADRASGKVIPMVEVVEQTKAFAAWMRQGVAIWLHSVCDTLTMVKTAREVAGLIDTPMRMTIGMALDIGKRAGLVKDWMAEAFFLDWQDFKGFEESKENENGTTGH